MNSGFIMCILKILIDLCSIKQNTRVRNTFVRIAYSVLVVKRFIVNIYCEHKEDCLVINGKQSVKLESGLLVLKIILNKYLILLKFMLILNVF